MTNDEKYRAWFEWKHPGYAAPPAPVRFKLFGWLICRRVWEDPEW
jgi:hypothetical protein